MPVSSEYEKLPRKELEKLQLERLQCKVREVYEKVPFYRRAFEARGVTPTDIQDLADVTKLPFTSKLDFRDNYPHGLVVVPLEQIIRIPVGQPVSQ